MFDFITWNLVKRVYIWKGWNNVITFLIVGSIIAFFGSMLYVLKIEVAGLPESNRQKLPAFVFSSDKETKKHFINFRLPTEKEDTQLPISEKAFADLNTTHTHVIWDKSKNSLEVIK